jgi:PDZ domain-containing secreted protein
MKFKRYLLSLAALATVVVATPATAQDTNRRDIEERLRALRAEIRDLEGQLGSGRTADVFTYSGFPRVLSISSNRAQLGVYVQQRADEETDEIGALLSGVVTDGPADEAGLQEGDIVTTFDGESLVGRYPAARRGESEPGKKLVDLVGDMEPGDQVVIGYRRGNESRTATVTLEDPGSGHTIRTGVLAGTPWVTTTNPRVRIEAVGPEGNFLTILRGNLWSDMELVALNEELGAYFGTSEGLLVIQAPDQDGVDLQGGDVILSINGREARTPSRALRILQSYEEGETAQIEIMRERRRMTVTITVPERDEDAVFDGWAGMWRQRF